MNVKINEVRSNMTLLISVRKSFVERFGEDQAIVIENAAREHGNGINNKNIGSDPFKWAISIVIGYECVEKYAEYHGFTISFSQFKDWVIQHGDLRSHDGDLDYISMFIGTYEDFTPKTEGKL